MTPPESGKRIALLMGAPDSELDGVEHDIELMTHALEQHGFECESLLPATRAKILEGLEALRSQVESEDVVLIYYAGHGSRIERISSDKSPYAPGEPSYYRFLAPSDFDQSVVGDFRGVTNIELSRAIEQITNVTENVALIFDCCHAGRLFRHAGETSAPTQPEREHRPVRYRLPSEVQAKAAAAHYEELRAKPETLSRDAEANPFAVRLLASDSAGKAYELHPEFDRGIEQSTGAMTHALVGLLRELDPRYTTWQDLGRKLKASPRGWHEKQRVTVEGPHRRLLFSLEQPQRLAEHALEFEGANIHVAGGALAGLEPGDRLHVFHRSEDGQSHDLGGLTITQVQRGRAMTSPDLGFDPERARGEAARPVRFSRSRARVEFVGLSEPERAHELITTRLRALGLVEVDSEDTSLPLVARICCAQGKIQLEAGALRFDKARRFTSHDHPISSEQLAEYIVDGVHRLARRHMLTSLSSDALDGYRLSWGTVENNTMRAGLQDLSSWSPSQRLTLRMETTGTQPRYLSVLSVCETGKIRVRSQAKASGVRVDPGDWYQLGQKENKPLRGIELERPRSIDTKHPLKVTLLAFVSSLPVDLRAWEQFGVRPYKPNTHPLAPEPVYRDVQLAEPEPPVTTIAAIHRLELVHA